MHESVEILNPTTVLHFVVIAAEQPQPQPQSQPQPPPPPQQHTIASFFKNLIHRVA